ncbi:MAG: YitT family protein [Paenibacillaceae bacterium]
MDTSKHLQHSRHSNSRRRKERLIPAGSPIRRVIEYAYLLLGSIVIALSFNLFLNPNRIATGGVAGLSTIAQQVWGITPAYIQWGLNIPLWLLGLMLLGGRFGIKTAIGSFILPLFVLLTAGLSPLTDQALLASVYGGMGIGVGLGLVFRGRGSTGGMDVVAQVLHHYSGISLGTAIALLDGVIIISAGFVFSAENALYALIGLFISSKSIDLIQVGLNTSKVAFIISDASDQIAQAVLYELDRGLTRLQGIGGYTNEEKPVMMVVIGQREVTRLKQVIRDADPYAFVIISGTSEVFGEGFKLD